mmetsp:Transcript_248/g.661  ORF Transcript_248/g.661 Transcript_248/m.661 type:complete len:499 (+) Transcript_248:188-1684(+)
MFAATTVIGANRGAALVGQSAIGGRPGTRARPSAGRQGAASTTTCAAAPEKINGATAKGGVSSEQKITAESLEWVKDAIPAYLTSRSECSNFDQWLRDASTVSTGGEQMDSQAISEMMKKSPVWLAIRSEAGRDAAAEPILSSFLWGSILSHDTFERALAFILANRLADATMLPTELFDIFYDTLKTSPETVFASMQDCQAAMERDPACRGYSDALLYYKGFHAVQAQRCAHVLWKRGRTVLALALQSKVSEVLAIDIHPATRLGHGLLLDHGTGVVIGETAVVGNYCSILQGVTLGGTGKASGDRHPKIGDGVLLGANATVLGNIRVGEGAQIAACSLVLKDVPERTMVAGTPAKLIGRVEGRPALEMHQWIKPIDLDPYDNTPSKEWSDLAGRVTNEVPSATATTTSCTTAAAAAPKGPPPGGAKRRLCSTSACSGARPSASSAPSPPPSSSSSMMAPSLASPLSSVSLGDTPCGLRDSACICCHTPAAGGAELPA